jgi:hypothetical protein
MDIHPWTKYEIARLRNEERLLRAYYVQRALEAPEEEPGDATVSPRPRRFLRRVLGSRRAAVIHGLLVIGILASTSIALAHNTRWEWTEPKAEQVAKRDAVVRLAPAERTSLEHELRMSAAYYSGLATAAREELDEELTGRRRNPTASHLASLGSKFRGALRKVRGGLPIQTVDCRGSGRAAGAGRFEQFRCVATSNQLLIPSAEVTFSEHGKIEAIVEGRPRSVGPFQARLAVRVSGRSTIAYRRIA